MAGSKSNELESGQELDGLVNYKSTNNPLVSIITVVYNGEEHIEQTIQSVLNQTYKNIEYIIIDGASTDGTPEIIKRYEKDIDYWISEPDKGIYAAMNKGIIAATGEWINFMNAGDTLANRNTVESVFAKSYHEDADIIYGSSYKILTSGEVLSVESSEDTNRLAFDPIYRHNASFVRRSIHKIYPFDLSKKKFGYALDFHSINTFYKKGYRFKKVPEYILYYIQEGVSFHPYKNIYYNFLISIDGKFRIIALLIFFKKIIRAFINRTLKRIKMLIGF
ncbi:glycosyltransferase family 2 protein [Draconibacterium sp. IB214405]|uniref:glycosyltransferase family 2 protein n=1 Tax=Draconibacterium sp. IB214405 TaxID=3097352 RepID=UPI002A0F6773|nr:glycosyltransferase family 2 protein [Draconibacterium sp. IB214405]MDX8338075.1 glycosyltransferase family 2 protein [Draconibacterium sp. IB214405]